MSHRLALALALFASAAWISAQDQRPFSTGPVTDAAVNPFGVDAGWSYSGDPAVIFPGSLGVLSATGSATAHMNTLGPFPAAYAGTNLDFAVLSIAAGQATHASPTTRVALVP
jgi:hypothetical protein